MCFCFLLIHTINSSNLLSVALCDIIFRAGGSKEELALGLFVTRLRIARLDKMSPDRQGGFYLLVLGADNF